MTERNGQLATKDSATAPYAMDQPRVECENTLDDAKSTAIPHTLKANVVEELSFGNRSVTPPSSNAPNAPGQVGPPLPQAQCDYWKDTLAGALAVLDLPTDRPRLSHRFTDASRIPVQIDAHLTLSLKQVAIEYDMDLSMVVMAGWSAVLARLSSQDNIIIGYHDTGLYVPVSGYQAASSNIIPLRLDLSGEPSISQLLERVQKSAHSPMDHTGFPLGGTSEITGSPLFQATFQWSQASLHSSGPVQAELELQLQLKDNEVVGSLLFHSDLFNPDTVDRHVGYLSSILQAIAADVDRPVTSVDLLSQAERDLVLGKWNATKQVFPTDLCIHHLFEQQVERTPQAAALVFNGQSLTYTELNERANKLAHHLIKLGVQPNSLIAICVERSFAMIIGVLAILKAGGAYVPLDPVYASNRLKDILADASPSIVVADATGRATLGEAVSSMTVVDPNELQGADRPPESAESIAPNQPVRNPLVPGLASSNLAYIIYTSGSTGKPKGVMIEHQGVVNLIHGRPDSFGISTSSRILQFTSLNFDHSVSEIFSTLTSGASLHLIQDDIRLDQHQLWKYLMKHSITHVSLTPALLQNSRDMPTMSTLQMLIIMGEALPAELVRSIQPLVPEGRILNSYGPTEITVSAITWRCPQNFMGDIVPIGRPIPNKTIYVLDQYRQPVPIGAVGELYIGGAGIAKGYLNQPELTSKVFLPDPFVSDKEARMYKTGDLVRYLPDGNIVFIGRNDHQVKIRGFRIELGEIEARLVDHLLVDKAVVVTVGEGSDKRLVGYVVARPDDNLQTTLRSHLMSCLPDYMVPAAIVRLDSLPINSNGKLDRKALPLPDSDAFAREVYEEPQGEVETAIAQIWAEVLKLDRVSRNDNFFALGGHSLLVVRLMNRVTSLGVQMPLSTIFASPTLSSFAESASRCMDKETTSYSTIHPIPREGDLPLSFSQQRMWFLAQMGVSESYHILKTVRLHGDLNRDAWQRALDTLFARHEALRSVFVAVGGEPQVRLLPAQSGIPIRWEDLRASLDAESQLERMCADEASSSFDLEQGPLIRILMVQLDSTEHVFMTTQHHIVSDGWSSAIFSRELSTLYGAYCNDKPEPLPPLSIQYPDYATWQKQWYSEERRGTHAAYWKAALTDAPVLLDLPTDRPRPLQQSFAGDTVPIRLGSGLARGLKLLCQQHGVTLYMTILAAWSCVLSRMSGQDDIVIGSPSANRNHHQIESLIGLFVNTLAVRIDLSGDPTLRQLLERVRKTSLDAQNHQDLPFEQVVDIVQPPRSLSHSPLFQVMFVWQNNEISEWQLPGLEVTHANSGYDIAKFDLNLTLYESDNEITGGLSYSTALFDRTTMERHVGYLCTMLKAVAAGSDRPVMSVDLLSKAECDLVLGKWNATKQVFPTDLCIHHLFEQQVERTPQAAALVFNGQSLTYTELNERANKLAHHLIKLGVQPNSLIAICVERSFAMIIGVLAILKAGGAYVPLDPVYASNRLKDILADASPSIVVADATGRATLGEAVSSMTVVDPNELQGADRPPESAESIAPNQPVRNPLVPGLASSNLAYIIYTSGSTGKPKGVMIEHQGVVNLIHGRPDSFGISTSSRILQFTSLNFDHSVSEIFSTLTSGASLHLIQDDIRLDQHQLWKYLMKHSITHVSLTPALLQNSRDMPTMSTLQMLIIMGEALPAELVRSIQPLVPEGRILNSYGPTEITVSAITWRCPQNFMGDIVPIGRPIPNKTIYVLDQYRQPVPIGAVGELYIGGAGIAKGYLNQPELTSKVFLPDPFVSDKEARMYKTGDLVRYLPDGNIVFIGRNDHQVKIRGFRIELGEIEARLVDHLLVDKAVVVTVGEGSDKRLVGYVVARPDDNLQTTLRSHLMSCLPDYMVPAAIVRLDSLPINSNGKLDRKALPLPDSDAFAREVYEEPQGEVETAIAQIWAEVLKLDRVSRNDNFFALGGHSLLAVRLMNRVTSLGVQMPLSTIFASPTLSSFAESASRCMDKETTSYSTIHPIPREGDLPLSFSQQRMWFLAQMKEANEAYHIPVAIRFHGDLDRDAWKRTLDTLYSRHEALRSVFATVNGHPRVRLLPSQSGMPTRWVDLRGTSDAEARLKRMIADESTNPFDLAQGPLIRVLMVQLDSNDHVFMFTQHHILSDGSSLSILQHELSVIYSAYCSGKSNPLPPLSIQQADYAAWQRQWLSGERLEMHTTYWKTALKDAPVLLDLPTDRPRPPQQSYAGDKIPIHLDSQLTRALRQLSPENGITAYMAILAAWGCVLSRMSGQDDIVIGSPTANRNHPQIESLLGVVINALALRIDLSGNPTLRQLLERVRQTCLGAQNHQDLPFEQVVDIVQPPRTLSHSPLFQAMFVVQINEISKWHLPGIDIVEIPSPYKIARFDVNLGLYETGNDSFMGGLSYSTALYDRETMERHVGYLYTMLHAMVEDIDRPVTSVDLLSQAERNLVLGQWNETQQNYPDHLCIHHLFEQQVERTPYYTALVFNGQSITYAELNERANRLAHHLIELGVKPDSLVAICVERSFAMIVGVLAVLKAGGAYVPLDPSYPKERLAYILEDAAPTVALADSVGSTTLDEASQHLQHQKDVSMTMVDPNVHLPSSAESPKISGLTSRHLAYIVYTSGSTGRPKGVMVEHRGVVNYTLSRIDDYALDVSGKVLQFASLNFDLSVMEIFTALSSGASLHLLEDHTRFDRQELWKYLEQHMITHAILPPAILQECKNCPPLSAKLTLISTGEELSATLLRDLQRLIPNGCIVNECGATEVTVNATSWRCPRNFNGDVVPIGRPFANMTIYLLDKYRQPVPMGAVGELYIGGVGVARGYHNRPELTATVFLPDPFAGDKGARMYKTGDLGRYLPDGNIIFLGRNDHQVQIRGFRVELGEIEARLRDHPLVQSAAVVAIGDGSDKRLVAYVVAKQDDQLVHKLWSHLKSCLPDYMVPAAFVRLDDLPLSANGKLDRIQLPQPDNNAMAYQPYEAPCGIFENTLMTIWMDLLHVNKIGRHDNFFMLGGHSLLAVRMVTQIRSLIGFKITLGTLFMAPTIAELVPHLTTGNSQEDAFDVLFPIRPRGMRLPLFCVHDVFGVSWGFIGLSKHLHPDQPIYGLQARGFVDGAQFATTIEDMALDYIEQIKRIQPHGPYCLLGYSFGGIVVHAMAAHLEHQGERVALLAVMDTSPRTSMMNNQASIEKLEDKAQGDADDMQLFVNRLRDTFPTPYIEKFKHVCSNTSRLLRNHNTFSRCNSDMILFRAVDQETRISPDKWKPYIMGEIDVFDINCGHAELNQPAPLAEIGGTLAQRLNEIHIREMREL
ncbi:MAG: Non-ribosomal peptide synthetase module [Benniella sp.]|nr:MAG: Non-ribosomal peptide synthetase module [Benniella sp.]